MNGCEGCSGIFANQSINCAMRQIVRNYGARNNLKSMKRGDLAFFYHRFVSSRDPETIKMRNKKEKYHLVPYHLFIYLFQRQGRNRGFQGLNYLLLL